MPSDTARAARKSESPAAELSPGFQQPKIQWDYPINLPSPVWSHWKCHETHQNSMPWNDSDTSSAISREVETSTVLFWMLGTVRVMTSPKVMKPRCPKILQISIATDWFSYHIDLLGLALPLDLVQGRNRKNKLSLTKQLSMVGPMTSATVPTAFQKLQGTCCTCSSAIHWDVTQVTQAFVLPFLSCPNFSPKSACVCFCKTASNSDELLLTSAQLCWLRSCSLTALPNIAALVNSSHIYIRPSS